MSMWFVCLGGRSPRDATAGTGTAIDALDTVPRYRTRPAAAVALVCGNFRTHLASNRGLSNQPEVNSCNRTNKT